MLDYVEGPGDGTPEQGGAGATARGPGDPADGLTNSFVCSPPATQSDTGMRSHDRPGGDIFRHF